MDMLHAIIDYGIIGLLIVLSFWAIAVAIERWLFYRQADPKQYSDPQTYEIDLTKRLAIIGTVAANAPYIGLLGTVLGIMLTFHSMGTSGTMAAGTIMVGLSLALKATAIGLLVAIPSVALNNVLRRRVSELLTLYHVQQETSAESAHRHPGDGCEAVAESPRVGTVRMHGRGAGIGV
jgi:biopolymer transport protein ExbB